MINSELMLQELSDDQLDLVTGGSGNIYINENINITTNYTSIVYAPVYVYGTVINSSIDNGNTYIQGSHFGSHH